MNADPERVAFLADAYRHRRHSQFARWVVAERHRDFTADECRLALAEVIVEAEAELILLREFRRALPPDPPEMS